MRYLYMAGLLAAIAIGALALELVFVATGGSLSIYRKSGWGLPLLYVMALVVTLAFLRLTAPGGFASLFAAYARNAAKALAGFFAFALCTALLLLGGFAVMAALGVLDLAEDGWSRFDGAFAGNLAIGLALGFLVAFIEELLFRGALMRFLRWNAAGTVTLAAVLVSAVIFALAHNIADPFAWFGADQLPLLVGLCLLGVLLAATYLSTGSIACAMGLHFGLLSIGEVLPRTGAVAIDFTPWWMGGTGDIRMAPITWAMFVGLLAAIWLAREPLRRRFAVEDFVGIPQAPGR